MMNTAILISITLCLTLQNIAKKAYGKKAVNGTFTFSAASAFFAVLFFLCTSFSGFEFKFEFVPYSIGFAVSYAAATVCSVLAFFEGSLSLSSLIISYSLILPTLYGIIFLDEGVTPLFIIGIILLVVSLVLVNSEKKGEAKKITPKWLIYISIAFVGNGGCSIVQKMQQRAFDGRYRNEFMIIALVIVTLTMLLVAMMRERENLMGNIKCGAKWYSLCGLANGAVNLLVMICTLPAAILFPTISAGGVVATFLVSFLFYKEKFSKLQYIGVLLGLLSVVILSI